MNMLEQIAIAGISIVIGAGALKMAFDADGMAAGQTQMIQQMANPEHQDAAVERALQMSKVLQENARADAEVRSRGQNPSN